MDHVRSIAHHLVTGILDVPARTAITACITDQFHFLSFIPIEGTFPVFQGPETLPARTPSIPVTNDDADLFHAQLLCYSFCAIVLSVLHFTTPKGACVCWKKALGQQAMRVFIKRSETQKTPGKGFSATDRSRHAAEGTGWAGDHPPDSEA
jgi:hypothetical protein